MSTLEFRLVTRIPDTSCNSERAPAPGSHGLQSTWTSVFHGSLWKLLVLTVRRNFSRVRCDSSFSQGLKDTSYSFYQSQNMVEIQHELSFLSISLETTWTESYNAGTPSSNHYYLTLQVLTLKTQHCKCLNLGK